MSLAASTAFSAELSRMASACRLRPWMMAPRHNLAASSSHLSTALLLLVTVLVASDVAGKETGGTSEEGWSLERMVEVYGDHQRRSTQNTWPVLVAPTENITENSGAQSWLGGVSQYYGAGGVSPIDSSAGVLTCRFNAMVPGFGESGARSLRPRLDTSLDDASLRARNALLNTVETTLWAASILRDNMVTVFGYVLNLPDNPLSADLYTSLYNIYNEVRSRRFQTASLLRQLKDMYRVSPNRQFIILFRSMKYTARPYMKSAIEFWANALDNNEINVDEILRPNGGPLIVDFLEGIDPSVLKLLSHPPEFPEMTARRSHDDVSQDMGMVVANTLSAIADGTLPLTQTLFALLMQMRPSETIVPHKTEMERYISDSLRLRKVKGWRTIIKQAESARGSGGYEYARAILWALTESSEVESSLQDAARIVHTYFKPPLVTFSNPYYNYTSFIMSKPTIDILYILKGITSSEYPEDVIDAKNRLKYYIENGHLDMEFVVKGFNRFDHVEPINLVIAILTRVETRLPTLPQEIRSSVKYLKMYLVFKKFLSSLSPRIPAEFLESPFLLDSFVGTTMPKRIHNIVVELEANLRKVRLPVSTLIDETSVEECARPRQCILNVYSRIVKNEYVTGKTKKLMMSLIASLDIDGEPLKPTRTPEYKVKINRKKCSKKSKKRREKVNTMMTAKSSTTANAVSSSSSIMFTKPTTAPTFTAHTSYTILANVTILTYPKEEKEIEEDDRIIYPGQSEMRLLFPMYNQIEMNQKPDYTDLSSLLPATEFGTPQDIKIRPIREFLKIPNLYSMLGSTFRPQMYATKIELTKAILKRALYTKIVKFDSVLYATINDYLLLLQSIPHRQNEINKDVRAFPIITEEYEKSPVNYEEPHKNLPSCTNGTPECDSIFPIRIFLSDENLYYKLGPYFRPGQYRTKGSYIKALLHHSMQQRFVQNNVVLYRSLKQFQLHLQEGNIKPYEIIETRFPTGDFVRDNEPPNWKHPLTLLPATTPGTAEHVKMRYIRQFFGKQDFWRIMGPKFRANAYQTKAELLIAVLGHALTLNEVKLNAEMYQQIRQYHYFLQTYWSNVGIGTRHGFVINMETLVNALPYPETTEEELYLRDLKQLFGMQKFLEIMQPEMLEAQLGTRGAAMQMALQQALLKQKQLELQEQDNILKALNYFKDRVLFDGYGAQSVDYVIVRKKPNWAMFPVLDLFRAINHSTLNAAGRLKVKRLIDFVSYNFDPIKYLDGFQSEKYTTKGEFLKAAFRHMSNLEFLQSPMKEDMVFLQQHIMSKGPGAEQISVTAVDRYK